MTTVTASDVSFAILMPLAPSPEVASQYVLPLVTLTTATEMSLFVFAAGLKKTGRVGGSLSRRLRVGT